MKKLPEKDENDGVAALDQLRERIIPQFFTTPVEVFKRLIEGHPDATHIKQVLMWDEKGEFLTLANHVVPSNPDHGENDTRPCPPCCPDCPE